MANNNHAVFFLRVYVCIYNKKKINKYVNLVDRENCRELKQVGYWMEVRSQMNWMLREQR
jgi:hypothetical protein